MPDTTAPSTAPEESQVAVTQDEEAAEKAKTLDELRAAIQKERDDRTRKEQDLSHEIRMSELDVEEARLRAELAAEKQLSSRLDSSADKTFDNAEAAMKAAVERERATADLAKAEAKAKADATPNPLEDDGFVVDGGQPSVAAKSVAPTASAAKSTGTTTTGKAAK